MSTPEKRKKKRRTMIVKIEVCPTPPDRPIKAEIVNISYGGIGLLTAKPVKGRVQVILYHNLGFRSGQQVPEALWGQVTWRKKIASNRYAIGISYEGLNPKEHSLLLDFLDRAAQ